MKDYLLILAFGLVTTLSPAPYASEQRDNTTQNEQGAQKLAFLSPEKADPKNVLTNQAETPGSEDPVAPVTGYVNGGYFGD